MAKVKAAVPVPTISLGREVGAQVRISSVKKTDLRIGWEAAAEIIDVLEAYDAKEIANTADVLRARYS